MDEDPELGIVVPVGNRMAAQAGASVLTHLLGQSIEEVAEKVALYRKTWAEAGHPGRGHVTLPDDVIEGLWPVLAIQRLVFQCGATVPRPEDRFSGRLGVRRQIVSFTGDSRRYLLS